MVFIRVIRVIRVIRGSFLLSALRRVVFNGVREVQSQVAEFLAQGLPGDPQQAGGLVLVPPVCSRTRGSKSRSTWRCVSFPSTNQFAALHPAGFLRART